MNTEKLLQEMRDDLNQIDKRLGVIEVKLDMLQRVVYGAVSVILLAVLTAAMKFVLAQ